MYCVILVQHYHKIHYDNLVLWHRLQTKPCSVLRSTLEIAVRSSARIMNLN